MFSASAYSASVIHQWVKDWDPILFARLAFEVRWWMLSWGYNFPASRWISFGSVFHNYLPHMCCTEANNCCLYKTVAERFCFFSHFDGMCDKEVNCQLPESLCKLIQMIWRTPSQTSMCNLVTISLSHCNPEQSFARWAFIMAFVMAFISYIKTYKKSGNISDITGSCRTAT